MNLLPFLSKLFPDPGLPVPGFKSIITNRGYQSQYLYLPQGRGIKPLAAPVVISPPQAEPRPHFIRWTRQRVPGSALAGFGYSAQATLRNRRQP